MKANERNTKCEDLVIDFNWLLLYSPSSNMTISMIEMLSIILTFKNQIAIALKNFYYGFVTLNLHYELCY